MMKILLYMYNIGTIKKTLNKIRTFKISGNLNNIHYKNDNKIHIIKY